jgi:hypothetical protein
VKAAARATAATPGSRAPGAMRAPCRPNAARVADPVSRVASEASAAGNRFATSACAPRAADPVSRAAPAPSVRPPGKFAPVERAPHAAARTSLAAPAMPVAARRRCAGTRPTE